MIAVAFKDMTEAERIKLFTQDPELYRSKRDAYNCGVSDIKDEHIKKKLIEFNSLHDKIKSSSSRRCEIFLSKYSLPIKSVMKQAKNRDDKLFNDALDTLIREGKKALVDNKDKFLDDASLEVILIRGEE